MPIKYNILDSPIPCNNGFIGQVTASRETIELHKARISNYIPSDAPEFQVGLHEFMEAMVEPCTLSSYKAAKET
jgi:hypothetical protein